MCKTCEESLKILKNAYLTFEEFLTILTEIEAALNSRHLTYSYDELGESLTPSTLILGKRLLTVPDKVDFKDKLEKKNSESLNKRTCYLSNLLDRFRARWRKEYLTGRREFHNCNIKKHLARPVKVGDIVSIYDDNVKRQLWHIGRITEVLRGKDGNVLSAVVRTVNNNQKTVTRTRPIQKLISLEIMATEIEVKLLEMMAKTGN